MSVLEVVTACYRRGVDSEEMQKGIRLWYSDDTARGPIPPVLQPKNCEIALFRDKSEVTITAGTRLDTSCRAKHER
jgi:hypothetical protein